jgi:hypothetical protein
MEDPGDVVQLGPGRSADIATDRDAKERRRLDAAAEAEGVLGGAVDGLCSRVAVVAVDVEGDPAGRGGDGAASGTVVSNTSQP